MDKDKNSIKRLVFMKKARDFFNKQIEKEENRQKRQLTNEERTENRKKNANKARLVATVAAISFGLGIVGGSEGRHLLDSGKTIEVADKSENSVTIDAEEFDKKLYIENSSADRKQIFVNAVQIGEEELESAKNIQELIHNVCLEVNKLKESEQIETYIKTLYANNYNKTNGTNITSDDITIHREKAEEYKEPLEDDEKSNRIKNSPYKRILEQGINVITVTVDKEGNKEETKLAYVENRRNYVKAPIYFASIYEKEQETLENLLPVIDTGLDFANATGLEYGGSKEVFIDSVIQYKKFKMNEIATERMELDGEEKSNIEKKDNQVNDENQKKIMAKQFEEDNIVITDDKFENDIEIDER